MDADITNHLHQCHQSLSLCPDLNSNLSNTTDHNKQLHVDLLGPIGTADNRDSFILCLTDAHPRYIQLASLAVGSTETITNAILKHWICLFGTLLQIAILQVKEPWARIIQQIQCCTPGTHIQMVYNNAVANLIMTKLLATLIDDTSIIWTPYLYPLIFNYNTSFRLNNQSPPFARLLWFPPWNSSFTTKSTLY